MGPAYAGVMSHGSPGPDATANDGEDDRGGLALVLGCDGSWAGPGGAGSGYLVSSGGTHLLVDLGPGTFATLQTHLDPALIAAVIIRPSPSRSLDRSPLPGHPRPICPSPADRSRSMPRPSSANVVAWLGRPPSTGIGGRGRVGGVGALDLSFFRTDHGVETLAVRIDGATRTLGYSADTGPGWSLTELGAGLDLVLCEASYTVEHEGTAGHMSGRQAGEQAARAGVVRLVLTHRWPTVGAATVAVEAAAAFGQSVEQAEIGKVFRV